MDEREEEQRERTRPRIVDKRRSARTSSTPPASSTAPTSEPQPVPAPPPQPPPDTTPAPPVSPRPAGDAPTSPASETAGDQVWTPEQEAAAQQMARELAERPSSDWVLNIAVTLANVAGAKMEMGVPEDARLAIDTLESIVTGVGAQLGGAEAPLKQTLAQLQIAYSQSVQSPPAP